MLEALKRKIWWLAVTLVDISRRDAMGSAAAVLIVATHLQASLSLV